LNGDNVCYHMRQISACFRNLNETDWRALQAMREKHNVTWSKFIHQLTTYPEIVERALEMPPEIDDSMVVDATTLHRFIPAWMDNIRENFADMKNGLDVRDIPKTDLPALIIGGGPSLYRNNHLQLLADQGFDGVIFATDRVLKDCLDVGVVPDYVCVLDGQESVTSFIDHQIVDDYAEQIGAIMCVMTHPKVVKRWGGKIYWFSNSISDNIAPNVAYLLHHLLKKTEMTTAGHVSSLGWSVAHTIGSREIALIGVDLSYPRDTPLYNISPSVFRYRLLLRSGFFCLYQIFVGSFRVSISHRSKNCQLYGRGSYRRWRCGMHVVC